MKERCTTKPSEMAVEISQHFRAKTIRFFFFCKKNSFIKCMYIFSSGTLKLVSNGNTRAHFFSFPLSFPLLRGKKKKGAGRY